MSFCFGLRPPKAVSALRDFNARGRQSRPCAILRCAPNLCRTRSAAQKGRLRSGIYTLRTRQNKRTSERMSFCFGLRPPKAVSALRDFNARGRQSRPCAKVFTCGENACTAHSRRRPEGRVGAVLSACREFENIQIVVTSQKKRTSERCLPIRKHREAREKRYSFGYAVFLILALMK